MSLQGLGACGAAWIVGCMNTSERGASMWIAVAGATGVSPIAAAGAFYFGAVVLLSPLLISMYRDGSSSRLDHATLFFPALVWRLILAFQQTERGFSASWGALYEPMLLFAAIATLLLSRWLSRRRQARGWLSPIVAFWSALVIAVCLRLIAPWGAMAS